MFFSKWKFPFISCLLKKYEHSNQHWWKLVFLLSFCFPCLHVHAHRIPSGTHSQTHIYSPVYDPMHALWGMLTYPCMSSGTHSHTTYALWYILTHLCMPSGTYIPVHALWYVLTYPCMPFGTCSHKYVCPLVHAHIPVHVSGTRSQTHVYPLVYTHIPMYALWYKSTCLCDPLVSEWASLYMKKKSFSLPPS